MDLFKIAQAIADFRNANGCQWKKKLKESILNGKQRESSLVQFKIKFTFDTLNKIKTVSTVEEIESTLNKDML